MSIIKVGCANCNPLLDLSSEVTYFIYYTHESTSNEIQLFHLPLYNAELTTAPATVIPTPSCVSLVKIFCAAMA